MEQDGTAQLQGGGARPIRERMPRWIRQRRWGHSRARLPGRQRLRELLADPRVIVEAARPAGLRRTSSPRREERLVGLLMLRDEDDVLDEMLRCAVQWFDRILVLDGTLDEGRCRRTDEILASFPEVVFVARDADVLGTQPTRDGARQVLLDEARRRYGSDRWIGVLHADEFMDQDPRPMLAAHNPLFDPTIRIRLVHAFLHTDDAAEWRDDAAACLALPVRERVRHVMWPGVPETRFFFDRGHRDYRLEHHSKVVPTSFRSGPLVDGYSVVQYNERSPLQAVERGRSRAATGWQTGHYDRLTGEVPDVFVDTLDTPQTPFAPEFANDPEGPFHPRLASDVPIGPLGHHDSFDESENSVMAVAREPSLPTILRWSRSQRARLGRTDRALVDHTARLLASRRLDPDQKRCVAREFATLTHRESRTGSRR